MAGGRPLGRPEAGGFTVVKYLATRRTICPAIRTVEGPSRPHIIKDQGTNMSISTQSAPERIIAFEVSKASLTVHLMPEDRQVVIENTPKAIRKLFRQIGNLETSFAICEASGGYERHVLACCADANLPVHRAHGTRTRNFARFLGLVSKTDAIDARMLALFAQKSDGLRLWQPIEPEAEELRALRRRRDDLAKFMRIEQNRLEHAAVKTVRLSLQRHVRSMTREMDGLDKQIA